MNQKGLAVISHLIRTFVTMLFVGSIQITMMGVLGIYIGKTFEGTKGRPLYIVNDTVNFRL